jgi:hypothetical protein
MSVKFSALGNKGRMKRDFSPMPGSRSRHATPADSHLDRKIATKDRKIGSVYGVRFSHFVRLACCWGSRQRMQAVASPDRCLGMNYSRLNIRTPRSSGGAEVGSAGIETVKERSIDSFGECRNATLNK